MKTQSKRRRPRRARASLLWLACSTSKPQRCSSWAIGFRVLMLASTTNAATAAAGGGGFGGAYGEGWGEGCGEGGGVGDGQAAGDAIISRLARVAGAAPPTWRATSRASSSRIRWRGSIGRGTQAAAPCGAPPPTNTVSARRSVASTRFTAAACSASASNRSLSSSAVTICQPAPRRVAMVAAIAPRSELLKPSRATCSRGWVMNWAAGKAARRATRTETNGNESQRRHESRQRRPLGRAGRNGAIVVRGRRVVNAASPRALPCLLFHALQKAPP